MCFPPTIFIEVVGTLLELKVKSYKNVFYCFIKFMSLYCWARGVSYILLVVNSHQNESFLLDYSDKKSMF